MGVWKTWKMLSWFETARLEAVETENAFRALEASNGRRLSVYAAKKVSYSVSVDGKSPQALEELKAVLLQEGIIA